MKAIKSTKTRLVAKRVAAVMVGISGFFMLGEHETHPLTYGLIVASVFALSVGAYLHLDKKQLKQ